MQKERIAHLVDSYRRSRADRHLPSDDAAVIRAVAGDIRFRIPSIRYADAHVGRGLPTHVYLFTHSSPAMRGALGACHALDLAFVFGTQRALGAGYAALPTTQTIYYAGRGTGEFEAQSLFDFALNYDIPVYRSVRPYVKAELRNAFNAQPLIGFDRTVTPNNNGPRDELGIPTEFIQGPNFGKNTVLTDNPVPREFRFSLGFRF